MQNSTQVLTEQQKAQVQMQKLLGHAIAGSTEIKSLVKQLTEQVVNQTKHINNVRPPQPEHQASAKALMDEVGKFRGRPLHYNYIGTGAGRGPFVELEDGSIKLDLINGIGIHLLGHSHPRVIEATIRGSLSDIVMQGNLQPNKEYAQLTKKLVELAGRHSRLRHAWLATCGTMANESALKIARQKNTPARKIIAFQNAFAGRSTMMAEVTDNPAYKVGLPEYNEVLRLPFYDKKDPQSSEKTLRLLKEHVSQNEGNICTLSFEPMQGEGGYQSAPREFFVPLFEFCKEKKIAIWADEVQTFTRTGELFAFETLNIGQYIDICTIAKTAQNAATLYTEEYNPKPGLIAGTFSGSTPTLTAGLEILDILTTENFLGPNGRIADINKKFVGMLNRLNETSCKGLLTDAGGLGLMCAVTPYDGSKEKVDALMKRMYDNGLIAFGCGKNPFRVRFLIPAIISDEEIKLAGELIEKSVLQGV